MAVKVGKQLLCNVPEAISYLNKKYEELNVKIGTKLYLHRVRCNDFTFNATHFKLDLYFINSSNVEIIDVNKLKAAFQDPKTIISSHSYIDDSDYDDTYEASYFIHFGSALIFFYSAADDAVSLSDTWAGNTKITDTISDI